MAATWTGLPGWRHAFGDVTPVTTLAFVVAYCGQLAAHAQDIGIKANFDWRF